MGVNLYQGLFYVNDASAPKFTIIMAEAEDYYLKH